MTSHQHSSAVAASFSHQPFRNPSNGLNAHRFLPFHSSAPPSSAGQQQYASDAFISDRDHKSNHFQPRSPASNSKSFILTSNAPTLPVQSSISRQASNGPNIFFPHSVSPRKPPDTLRPTVLATRLTRLQRPHSAFAFASIPVKSQTARVHIDRHLIESIAMRRINYLIEAKECVEKDLMLVEMIEQQHHHLPASQLHSMVGAASFTALKSKISNEVAMRASTSTVPTNANPRLIKSAPSARTTATTFKYETPMELMEVMESVDPIFSL